MASPATSAAPRSKARTRTPHALPCPTCGDTFSRIDHLSRHMRSHSQERSFVCPVCDKGFIRADSLSRHCRGHCFNADSGNSKHGNSNTRVTAACQRCSASKLRCDGEQPCARCHSKQYECFYVEKSRQRARAKQLSRISETLQLGSRRSEDELVVSQSSEGTSNMTIVVQQETMQEQVQSIDFHALNALTQAAMQANTPPITETDCGSQHAPQDPFPQSTTLNSIGPISQSLGKTLSNSQIRQQNPVDHGQNFELLTSSRPNDIQNYDGSWPAGNRFTAMNFENANMGGVEDHSPGATSFGDMGFDPMLGGSFEMTDWTTVDWMFLSEPSAPYESFGQDTYMMMGGEQKLQNATETKDGRTGEVFVLNNTHDTVILQQHSERSTRAPTTGNHRSGSPRSLNDNETTRMNQSPYRTQLSLPHGQDERNNETQAALWNTRKHDPDKHPEQWPTDWNPSKHDNAVLFPDLRGMPDEIFEAENFAHVPRLPSAVYEEIVGFVTEIGKEEHLFRPFLESSPPSLEAFNSFVQLYFEYFQPVFPMLHQPSFSPESAPWVLVLAVAAIGCRYSRIKDSGKCAVALQEVLRRAIQCSVERDNSISRKLWVGQAMVLIFLGMLYSGDRRLLELALVTKSGMITTCRRNGSMQKSQSSLSIEETTTGRPLESAWKLWRREESHRRVGFCAWLLDCQLPLYFDMCSAMTTDELQQNLPCNEALWEAPDPETWKTQFLESCRAGLAPNMQTALEGLSSKSKTNPAIGSFGRLLLIHAIHQTTWVMRRHMKDPLMQSIDPVCQGGCMTALMAVANSALDTLKVSSSDGDQDPRVDLNIRAHVHHVSLLIHAPLKALLAFAGSQAAATSGFREAQKDLANWRKQDNGRTARQAVLNASILFTLIRSQPSRAMHEPISLLVATLTIWAYHQLSQQQSRNEGTQATVRLDKIQSAAAATSWVVDGANLRGYITDVGNICGVGAGKRLLQLSCKALADMDAWSLSQGFLNVLTRLQNGLAESADQH